MKDIKIAFFDIDGTLVDFQKKYMTEKTRQALCALRANGIRICIATGRTPMTVPKFEGVAFDAYLTFNGAYCYDAQGTIFSRTIPGQDVERLIRNAAVLHRPVCVSTDKELGANGWEQNLADYFAIGNLVLESSPDFDRLAAGPVYQIMVGTPKEEYAPLMQGVTGAQIAAWWDRAVDVIPAAAGKGVGVQAVLDHYGLTADQAIAFGDGNNDLEMLQSVGTGVAMGNASQDLKAVATCVCPSCAQDGIYWYCKEQGLI